MNKKSRLLLAAPITGIIVAALYNIFINLVEKIQNYIWFDLGKTNEYAFMAIPLAIIGGIAIAGTIHFLTARGHVEYGHKITELIKAPNIDLSWTLKTLLIGGVSLIAGASLGPEAVLIPVCFGIGYLIAKKLGVGESAKTSGGLIGVIVLLSAFFNSYAAGLVTLALVLTQKSKKPKDIISGLVVGLLATATGILTLRFLENTEGYIEIPEFGKLNFPPTAILLAVVIAGGAMFIPILLGKIAAPMGKVFNRIPKKWYLRGLIAGGVVGIFYSLLGPEAFFSGKEGMPELLKNAANYSSLQLLWLGIGKLAVTAWSMVSIYRGGLVFPQLFVGLSLALLFAGTNPNDPWLAMLMVSSFMGIFTGSLGSILISVAFVLPLFGLEVLPIVIASVAGVAIVKYIFKGTFASASAL